MKYAKKRGVAARRAVARPRRGARALGARRRARMGELGKSWPGTWYGVKRFFAWLETKAYKMHIRVLLSKYRAYTPCAACGGARLKPDALLWRLGTRARRRSRARSGAAVSPAGPRHRRRHAARLPGLTIHDRRAAADRPRARILRAARRCRRRSTKRPTCCSPRSARGSATCPTWAWATSRSIASRARSRAAKCSGSTSPPRSARRSSTRCSCSTSRRSACIRATWAASSP